VTADPDAYLGDVQAMHVLLLEVMQVCEQHGVTVRAFLAGMASLAADLMIASATPERTAADKMATFVGLMVGLMEDRLADAADRAEDVYEG
jgi:hypothetical protein